MSEERRKGDKLIWYLMVTSMSIIILGGGTLASSINSKVDKIAGMEFTIQYIQRDISEIKDIFKNYLKGGVK